MLVLGSINHPPSQLMVNWFCLGPRNQRLEDGSFPFAEAYFQGRTASFREGIHFL